MFVFNFSIGSLEQSVKLSWLLIFAVLFTVFCCLSCFSAAVTKENLLKMLAIVSLTNFQILLRHPKLAFDWLCVSFFDY